MLHLFSNNSQLQRGSNAAELKPCTPSADTEGQQKSNDGELHGKAAHDASNRVSKAERFEVYTFI
jgi:hypothetical protein